MMQEVVGHEKILNFFEQAVENDKLSHAYCFIGPDRVGKRKVAETVAAGLLGVEYKFLNSSPDYWFIDRENDEKTGKLKKDISIEQIKDLVLFLHQSPFKKGGYKTAIISNVGFLNRSGSNALLKSLEEAHEKVVIFLLVNNIDEVLPTVASRTQKIFFAPVSDNAICEYLKKNAIEGKELEEIINYASGLPGKAVSCLSEPEILEKWRKEKTRFESLFSKPFYAKLQSTDGLFGDKKDHIKARAELAEVLDLWHGLVIGLMKSKICREISASSDIAQFDNISTDVLTLMESKIVQAKIRMKENAHPRLLVEEILLTIP